MGGLVAGAVYARAGSRVVVLEKNDHVGGAASVYRVGDLTVEASLHELDGLDERDTKTRWLRELGLLDSVEFIDVGDLYEVRHPMLGEPFRMPHGVGTAERALGERFPQHAQSVRQYFKRILGIRNVVHYVAHRAASPTWRRMLGAPLFPIRARAMIPYRKRSLGHVLGGLFGDDEAAKFALCAHLPYYADDPDAMWFPLWAVAQASYHVGGGHYPRGGSSVLATRLAEVIVDAGGEIRTGRRATRIAVADGRATGVEHVDARTGSSAETVAAPVVFGNAAPTLLAEMLPADEKSEFVSAYKDRSPSTSLWTMSLGFARRPSEFGVASWSTVVCPHWSRELRDFRRDAPLLSEPPGDELPHFIFLDYTQADSGLTPSAPFLGTICGLDRIENWRDLGREEYAERRAQWIEAMVGALDREFPGIADALVQSDMTTARSIEAYLGTPGGAVYGFAPEVGKAGFGRNRTPVEGLLLASAYAGSGGYSGSIMGGVSAAGRALRARSRGSPRAD